jgi:hypothetical protein
MVNLSGQDIVGIFDNSTFAKVFTNSQPLRGEIIETSKVMQHPVETGVIISDHHIINPIRITMQMMIASEFYSQDYQQMRTAFINATNLTVQTKTGVYGNMIIAEMPHQENPDIFDSIVISLNFQEVLFIAPVSVSPAPAPANYSPANPVDSNTVQTGQQNTKTVDFSASKKSLLDVYFKE